MLILFGTCAVTLVAALVSYKMTRDALSPAIIFSPLLTYIYVYLPFQMDSQDHWLKFPILAESLNHVRLVNLVNIVVFCIACTPMRRMKSMATTRLMLPMELTHAVRDKLRIAAKLLAVLAVVGFAVLIWRSGGFFKVFSRGKPFFSAGSGYLGELSNLAFPALVLFAFSWQGQRLTMERVLVALVTASPHLIMATLGGRRGPAFLVLITLAGCYTLVRRRTPRVSTVVAGLAIVGIFLIFLLTQRKNIHLGSEFEFDLSDTTEVLMVDDVGEGHEAIVGAAGIAVADYFESYYWGKRYLVILFVRPIPRQLWETKYQDLGMSWMVNAPGSAGFSDADWSQATGIVPTRGNAGGFITDMYIEFWWFGVFAVGLIGWSYKRVWLKARENGGFWTLFYFMLLALSVYLPSQSVQAWLVRLLILVVPAYFVWRAFIRKKGRA